MEESPVRLIEKKVAKILSPFDAFVQSQTSTSLVLAVSTVLAMLIANTDWHSGYQAFIQTKAGLSFGSHNLRMPIEEWVSSGLMALFFFLLGLELKREILAGELQNPKQIGIVLMAALGGMILPAFLYLSMNTESSVRDGWAIPVATDTAFALGALAFLKRKVDSSLFVFLTGLAIFDDLGAIVVIALYYTESLNLQALWTAAGLLIVLFGLNFSGVRRAWAYILFGTLLWWHVHESGVHGTIAGIAVALTIPARSGVKPERFIHRVRKLATFFEKRQKKASRILEDPKQSELVNNIEQEAQAATTPLQRWEAKLDGPIGLIVLPVFALCNAGIRLADQDLGAIFTAPLTLGIIAGLVIGKPIGITLFSLIAIKLRVGLMPEGMTLKDILGIGFLAGMGFTMSIFISILAFQNNPLLIEEAKLGIIVSTFLAGCFGIIWLLTIKIRETPTKE